MVYRFDRLNNFRTINPHAAEKVYPLYQKVNPVFFCTIAQADFAVQEFVYPFLTANLA